MKIAATGAAFHLNACSGARSISLGFFSSTTFIQKEGRLQDLPSTKVSPGLQALSISYENDARVWSIVYTQAPDYNDIGVWYG